MSCFAIGCGHLPLVANHTARCMDLVCSFVFPPVQLCKLQHSKSGHPELEKGLIRASKGLIGLFCWPFEWSYLPLPISNTSLLERQQGKGNPTVIAKTSTVRVIVTFSIVWSQVFVELSNHNRLLSFVSICKKLIVFMYWVWATQEKLPMQVHNTCTGPDKCSHLSK